MVEAGALPDLAERLPTAYGPPKLHDLPPCPEGFGLTNVLPAPPCQLQTVLQPVPPCQLQSVTRRLELHVEKWSTQDVAVLRLLFCVWDRAAACEATAQPLALKTSFLKKILKAEWEPSGVRLHAGQHVRLVSGRYEFDCKSLLEVVSKYRANPKGRLHLLQMLIVHTRKYYQVHYINV